MRAPSRPLHVPDRSHLTARTLHAVPGRICEDERSFRGSAPRRIDGGAFGHPRLNAHSTGSASYLEEQRGSWKSSTDEVGDRLPIFRARRMGGTAARVGADARAAAAGVRLGAAALFRQRRFHLGQTANGDRPFPPVA